jgi:TnpA family transposase
MWLRHNSCSISTLGRAPERENVPATYYWREMMRVILSIRQGHLLPSTILRKLGNYSRQNSLYKAFRELGRVIRTMFLLKFISDETLRRKITATTNKIESYNRFTEWIFFGGQGVISTNNPVEMEKRVKYNDLVASAIILLNMIDMTRVIEQLDRDEYTITPDTLATLSPYVTKHLQRFGDFLIDMETLPALPALDTISLSVLN